MNECNFYGLIVGGFVYYFGFLYWMARNDYFEDLKNDPELGMVLFLPSVGLIPIFIALSKVS